MVPPIGRVVSGDRGAYRYLPKFIGRFRSPPKRRRCEVGARRGCDEAMYVGHF